VIQNKKQFKLRLSEHTLERLNETVHRFGKRNAQEIITEILEIYLPFWEEAEAAKQKVIEQQRSKLSL
jgi:predicted DNA-binding protein